MDIDVHTLADIALFTNLSMFAHLSLTPDASSSPHSGLVRNIRSRIDIAGWQNLRFSHLLCSCHTEYLPPQGMSLLPKLAGPISSSAKRVTLNISHARVPSGNQHSLCKPAQPAFSAIQSAHRVVP